MHLPALGPKGLGAQQLGSSTGKRWGKGVHRRGCLERAETLTPLRLAFLPPGTFEMIIKRTKMSRLICEIFILAGAQVGGEHSSPHPAQGLFTSRCPIFWAMRRAWRVWAWLEEWPVCSCKLQRTSEVPHSTPPPTEQMGEPGCWRR